MGQIIKNSNGTFSMNGFSNKSSVDMQEVREKCFPNGLPFAKVSTEVKVAPEVKTPPVVSTVKKYKDKVYK